MGVQGLRFTGPLRRSDRRSAEQIGAASRFAVLPLDAVAGVITDAPAGDETVQRLTGAGVPILPA